MIYITQLIYVVPGKESIFDEFENIAIPGIARYNGRLLFRMRPPDNAFIGECAEKPYEVHLVEFASHKDFDDFKKDEERTRFLHLKEASISATILIQGSRI